MEMGSLEEFGSIVLLTLHLLCMNVASAGPVVAMWLDWKQGRGDELAGRLGRFLTWKSLTLLLLGSVFGLALGWLMWTPEYRATLLRFENRLVFGVWELLFSAVLYGVAGLIWWKFPNGKFVRLLRMTLLLLGSTNLLYHFPLLFILISDAAFQPEITDPVNSAEFRALIADGSVLSRATHFWLAAFAFSGIVLMLYGIWKPEKEDQQTRCFIWGARWALVPTVLQLPVGLWLLIQLPPDQQQSVLGADTVATGLLGVSIMGALWLMHLLASAAFGDIDRQAIRRSPVVMIGIIALMVAVLVRIGA